MLDRLRQPVFGPWSVVDVIAAFTVLLSPLVVLVMMWSIVDTVMDREDWWPVLALGRLFLVGLILVGCRNLYREIGRRPAGEQRHG